MQFSRRIIASLLLLLICSTVTGAQQTQPVFKIKKRLLKGTWQLVQSYAMGSLHDIKKDEYDEVIRFRPRHRFYQEVNYESNHWIIEGRWKVNRKSRTLSLSDRNYTLNKLEEHPHDLIFNILQLDKQNWSGGSTEKDQLVKVFYKRIKPLR